jgi:nucleotidyltransferase substrate binding protein (TIGR01987 family)
MTGQLDFKPLADAIGALGDALDVLGDAAWFDAQPRRVRTTLISGAVQSVEFVYELSIKSIRRSLERYFDDDASVDALSFRALIRSAAERGLLDDVEAWFGYREMRNITARTYDQAKAHKVLASAPAFLTHARDLHRRLSALRD